MRELHTERLLLRTPRERDAAEIMAIRNSAFVMKNNVMEVVDKEQMVHLIHREIDYEDTWYIERKEDGALLGMRRRRTAFGSMCARDVFRIISGSNIRGRAI